MDSTRQYEIEGLVLNIPLLYDETSNQYLEDYRQWMENCTFTPTGHPVMFAGEDACKFAEEESPGGCPDCGSCRFYRRAGKHTWIGVCKSEHLRRQAEGVQNE